MEQNWPSESQPRPRRVLHVVVWSAVIAVTLVVGLTGSVLAVGAVESRQQSYMAKVERDALDAAAKARAEERERNIAACQDEIGDFIEELRDIDSALDMGLNVGDYSDAVRDASARANDVDTESLTEECESAYDLAEEALSEYEEIGREWDDCVWETWCDTDYDLDLSGWPRAEEDIAQAYSAMNRGSFAGPVT